MDYSIREYRDEDETGLKECLREINTFENRFDLDYLPIDETVENTFASIIGDRAKGGAIYVAEAEGKIVGAMTLAIDNKNEEILVGKVEAVFVFALVVLEEYRRHGIGAALLEKAYEFARERGIRYVALDVYAGNGAAQALYEHEGFKPAEIYMIREL